MATEMKTAKAHKAVPLETLTQAEQAAMREAGIVRRGADNKPYVLAPFEKSYPVQTHGSASAPVDLEAETE